MKYRPHAVIKFRVSRLKKSQAKPLAAVLESLAREYGFSDNYEMAKVADRNPFDRRLMRGAFGIDEFSEAIFTDPVFGEFDLLVEEVLAGEIAMTNADGFIVDDLEVFGERFDANLGQLALDVSFQYLLTRH